MGSKVPLVYYKEVDGKQVRIVIGDCEVEGDGTVKGRITNPDNEHIFKAMMGGSGEFTADLSIDGKNIVRQSPIDGMPTK